MRIQDVPIGGSFEYEGQVFTKTGPMTASAERGGQRMIPRHALLRPCGERPPAPAGEAGLPVRVVAAALAEFHLRASALVPEPARAELEAARRACLSRLGLPTE
ncbi:MAG: hypothetical protein RIR00_2028 [Pseudomonadota bacterium]|jgi:hypothetical protein